MLSVAHLCEVSFLRVSEVTTVPSNNPKIYGGFLPKLSWQCLLPQLSLSLELPFSLLMLSCEMCILCPSASLVCGGLN